MDSLKKIIKLRRWSTGGVWSFSSEIIFTSWKYTNEPVRGSSHLQFRKLSNVTYMTFFWRDVPQSGKENAGGSFCAPERRCSGGFHCWYAPEVYSPPGRASGTWRSKIIEGLVGRCAGASVGWVGRTRAPKGWWPPGTGTVESRKRWRNRQEEAPTIREWKTTRNHRRRRKGLFFLKRSWI